MKVALVYPEVCDLARFKEARKEFPPFGVLYLAAILEESGIEVQVFKINGYNKKFDFRGFEVVGFSIPSSATYDMVKETRFESLYSDNRTVLVGGVHPSFYPEETLIDLQADAVATGNSDKTIFDLVNAHDSRSFSQIAGLCFLSEGSIVKTPGLALDRSIDWLPLPARHLLEESDFIMANRLAGTDTKMAHIMISRGCPFSCRFCAVQQKQIQYRSGYSVKAELEFLKRTYSIGGFAIVDDNFVINKNAIKDICLSIKDLGLRWSALSRVDTIDQELLEEMFDAGCIELKFGVESGSERMLRAMGKNISCNQIRRAITLAHSIGLRVKIFLVHGFPGEDQSSTNETIALMKEIAPMVDRVSLFRFAPLPGSFVFKHAASFKLNIPERIVDWSKFHIHYNHYHWWGSDNDFARLEIAYRELESYISQNWKA
jgi:radical SAM superfamily enzyme YgiQ (UPF0313 family)